MAKAQPPKRSNSGGDAKPLTLQQKFWREVRGYAEALVIAYLVVTFLFTTVGVVGSSMAPNLDGGPPGATVLQALVSGDRVFIPKYDTWLRRMGVLGKYERGAVVVLREPANAPNALLFGKRNFFIKRVVGLPGDLIRIEAGQLYVNGEAVDQGFITDEADFSVAPVDFPRVVVEDGEAVALVMGFRVGPNRVTLPDLPLAGSTQLAVPLTDANVRLYYGRVVDNIVVPDGTPEGQPVVLDFVVPDGTYFVMGDNRSLNGSEDSRYFGPVDSIAIAGRATAVIWPPMRDGSLNFRGLAAPESLTH